jgi:N-acetylneuraminate synthase
MVFLIGEIGVNYYDIAKEKNISVMEAAKFMVSEAKRGGCDAAKFQTYKAGKIVAKLSPAYWDLNEEPTTSQFELFQKFDKFGAGEYQELANYCDEIGIEFMSTPFDLDAVDLLDPLVKQFKIASADLTNYPLLEKVASKGKQIIMSTGASNVDEITKSVKFINCCNPDVDVVLLHCVLSYPTKNEDANLNSIKYLKEQFSDMVIGYSDHTKPDGRMLICTTAATLGAEYIEKHFTTNKTIKGNDHYHSMDTDDCIKLVQNLRLLEQVLGSEDKTVQENEKMSRLQARRSIVLKRSLKKGDIIKEEDLIMKRPGTGFPPEMMDYIVGKQISRDLEEDAILVENDLI